MIKVGFDISQVAHQGGVAVYTNELSRRLQGFHDLEMVYFYSSLRKPYKGDLKNVKKYNIPPTVFEIMFNNLRFPAIEQFIGNVDIFHSSDWVQPRSNARKVTTYHDVIPLKFPQWSNSKIINVHKKRLEIVKKEVDMIIAVSESTKKDLIQIGQIDPSKIRVIHEGVDPLYTPQDSQKILDFKRKMGLPDGFILAIGGIGTRRNLERVKEACKGYNLVITGETIPYLDLSLMPLLYASASVLLYPSLYEGFGLPVLEAMAVGTPVITSNVSSLPEVGGVAVEYVSAEDVEEMKRKLNIVIKDPQRRKQMVSNGFEQVKRFSWDLCAQQTKDLYVEMMKK